MSQNQRKSQVGANWMIGRRNTYIDIPVSEMFPLLIGSNFLEIKGLIDLICKAVALQIQDDYVEENKEKLNVADPNLSVEELQKSMDKNAWAYETKT